MEFLSSDIFVNLLYDYSVYPVVACTLAEYSVGSLNKVKHTVGLDRSSSIGVECEVIQLHQNEPEA